MANGRTGLRRHVPEADPGAVCPCRYCTGLCRQAAASVTAILDARLCAALSHPRAPRSLSFSFIPTALLSPQAADNEGAPSPLSSGSSSLASTTAYARGSPLPPPSPSRFLSSPAPPEPDYLDEARRVRPRH